MANRRAINIFGSKVSHAHLYPAPRYQRIVETCAGGAGYALLHSDHEVSLYDLMPEVVGVWKYLIATDPGKILRLPLIEPGQEVSSLDCSEGGKLLIAWCCNQLPRPAKRLSSWGAYHLARNAACYWSPARREQAAEIASRVKHWTATLARVPGSLDMARVPGSLDMAEPATYFIDPPYQASPKLYGTPPIDYRALARWCRGLPGQVIVCERAGATWLPFRPLYVAPTSSRGRLGNGRCREAVWLNDWARKRRGKAA